MEWDIPPLIIGDLRIKLIQGGRGVKVSGANLASAVADQWEQDDQWEKENPGEKCLKGGAGIIAVVGLKESDHCSGNYFKSSGEALKNEVFLARSKAKARSVIGVNIMNVLSDCESLVRASIEAEVDMIISGAGVPKDLPKYLRKGSKTKLIPIVSSARLAGTICRYWRDKHHYLPDAIVVEGPKAGGHLGFSLEELEDEDFVEHGLERIIPQVVETVKKYETDRKIPIIAAGGIFSGEDIGKFLKLGAAGVQMATRFVTTYECDADIEFKRAYLNCKKEDIVVTNSPVGMPVRVIRNRFITDAEAGKKVPPECQYQCLITCDPNQSSYCIANALLEARKGNLESGFACAGANAWRCKKIVPVADVFKSLNIEYREGKPLHDSYTSL
jgi:nitronate monooxygenase